MANKITVDIVSDTVCPWCYVGKLRLEKAMAKFQGQKQFEVRWHPFFLNPGAPREGVNKLEMYRQKFGPERVAQMLPYMTEVFKKEGVEYSMGGLTGNTLDSHRLIWLAGQQGADTQNRLVDELFKAYFTQEQYIGDQQVLLDAAKRAGVEGASEFLADPDAGRAEVLAEARQLGAGVTGVPYFIINGRQRLSGAQEPETLASAFARL